MQIFSTIADIVRDLLIFTVAMTALCVALLVVIAKLRGDNPLKRLLTAIALRFGATAAAGALAIPLEPIPGVDALYDIGAPAFLIVYWIALIKEAWQFRAARQVKPHASPRPPQIPRKP